MTDFIDKQATMNAVGLTTDAINFNPTKYVDAQGNELVAVVHCKDCKWYKESKYSELRPMRFCYRLRNNDGVRVGYNWDGNDFCSYGERREDADALINDVTERYCKDCERRKGIKNGKQKVIYDIGDAPCRACPVDDMNDELENAPTVDAEPVRHGHWVHGKEISRDYIGDACVGIHYDKWWCSECNYTVEEHPLWKSCPNCRAIMDEPI